MHSKIAFYLLSLPLVLALFAANPMPARAQSTFTSQLTGVVSDSSGAGIPAAKVSLTDEWTNVQQSFTTVGRGIYAFTSMPPGTYIIRVEASNMARQERKGVVLAVNQQPTIDFTQSPGTVTQSVTITKQAPLLDTGNSSLGTDVTNEYVRDIPLPGRSMFGLVFLADGVTESAGSGIQDSYPEGTNFVSNGQRNATAEVRMDGALNSAREQGEGGTTNVYYQPSVEIVQEFKAENNSFSAEYDNNGDGGFEWTLTPTTIWNSRLALDRVSSPGHSVGPTLWSVGLPSILQQANGLAGMPTIQMDSGAPLNQLSLFNQCCTDVKFARTLILYSSAVSLLRGRHTLKTVFEQRQLLNNFGQPNYPIGYFYFPQNITGVSPTDSTGQGNSFADLLLGYGDPGSSQINIQLSVADKSWEKAFYVQDDFKFSTRLTLNLGFRYEWRTSYAERFNHQQYSDFTGSTGIIVPLPSAPDPPTVAPTALTRTTEFVGQGGLGRHLPVDRNNIAPRLGFAYSLNQKMVIRGGAGIYCGLNPTTNFQYTGTPFNSTGNAFFSLVNFNARFAALGNPFPNGLPMPQGTQYGANTNWGFSNSNNLGTQTARNAEIYQWNVGFQRLLPWEITVGVDFSASRSNHLRWGGDSVTATRNRNFLSSDLRAQISAEPHALDPNCDADGCVTAYVTQLVNNRFRSLFVQLPGRPAPMFNSASSHYTQAQIPLIDLLRPYPQFPGVFTGLPNLGASPFYNSIQVRFQKRANHYLSFEGNYTLSKAMGDSSAGFNAFVGTLNFGNVQQQRYFSASSRELPKDFMHAPNVKSEMDLETPPTLAANFARVDGAPHLFIANFSGLVPRKIAVPVPVTGAKVSIPTAAGNSLAFLPLLGQMQILHGTKHGGATQFEPPPMGRGAVVWTARSQ